MLIQIEGRPPRRTEPLSPDTAPPIVGHRPDWLKVPLSHGPHFKGLKRLVREQNLDTICEEPRVQMSYSDDDGVSWNGAQTLSKSSIDRVDYFPTIAEDVKNDNMVVSWFTNRLDDYQNAQNIEMVTVNANTSKVTKRQIVTTSSDMPNEPEADPLLQGIFIGDYIEVAAFNGTAYIGYNMNVRSVQFLFTGESVHQQDNYLSSATE